jgi:hypothetical protein
MIMDHRAHVFPVKLAAGQVREPVFHLLLLGAHAGRNRDVLSLGSLFQLIVGLRMVGNHALRKLFDFRALRFLGRQLPEFNFSHACHGGLKGEIAIRNA